MVWIWFSVMTDVGDVTDVDDNGLWGSWMPSFVNAHEWLKAPVSLASWHYPSPDDMYGIYGSYSNTASLNRTLGRHNRNKHERSPNELPVRPGEVGKPRLQEVGGACHPLPVVGSSYSCKTFSGVLREERKVEVDSVIRKGSCTCEWGAWETLSGGQGSGGAGECQSNPPVEVLGAGETAKEASRWWWSELCCRTWPPKCWEELPVCEDNCWCVGRRSSVPACENKTPATHRIVIDKLLSLFTCSVLRRKVSSQAPVCSNRSTSCAVGAAEQVECQECPGTRYRADWWACPSWRCGSRGPVVQDAPERLRLPQLPQPKSPPITLPCRPRIKMACRPRIKLPFRSRVKLPSRCIRLPFRSRIKLPSRLIIRLPSKLPSRPRVKLTLKLPFRHHLPTKLRSRPRIKLPTMSRTIKLPRNMTTRLSASGRTTLPSLTAAAPRPRLALTMTLRDLARYLPLTRLKRLFEDLWTCMSDPMSR